MDNDYHPSSKSALIEVILKERNALESLLLDLSDEQKKEKGVESDWSIKDLMAHIIAWERLAQDRINSALTGEPFNFPLIEGEDFVDKFNASVYVENCDASLDVIEAEFQQSHQDFLKQIRDVDEEFLLKPLPFEWAKDLTAQVLISANTHWHYLEHAESIRKWLVVK